MHNKKKKLAATYYARILFSVAITLFAYGFYLQVRESRRVMDPVKDVYTVYNNDSSVSVTPSKGNEVVSTNKLDSLISDRVVDGDYPIEEINKDLKNSIEKTYGITVLYGTDTDGYYVRTTDGDIGTISLKDPMVIHNQLTRLKNCLELYPKGIFKEIKDGGIPLTVLLIQKYEEESITGITDSSYNYANISISSMYSFEESFFHESYHYIERYMFKQGANFNSWGIYNPQSFKYGTIYNQYSYSNTFLESAYFVNNYAQTADTEDRASTFEYMMAPTKANCLNNGNPIWKKAYYMSMTIENVLKSVNSDTVEYWERYLK